MKARDLAALAALGVAGFAAYDKFGKKGEKPAKKKMGEDLDMTNQGAYELATRPRSQEAAAEKFSRQENDIPEVLSRQERDVPNRIMGRDAAGSRFTDRAAAAETPVAVAKEASEAKRPTGVNAAGSRFTNRDAAAEPDEKKFTLPGTQSAMGDFSRAMLPEQRIAAIDAKSGASSPSAKKTEALAAYSKAEQAKDVAKKRAAGTFKEIPQNVKPAVVKPTAVVPSAPVSSAASAKQRAMDERNYDSDLMKSRRQSVMDTVSNIPSGIANIFKPPEREFQNKTYRNMKGDIVRYNKGGAVKKMASGGMTSSKPSSASSRGDGIAQRGKTRGTMR